MIAYFIGGPADLTKRPIDPDKSPLQLRFLVYGKNNLYSDSDATLPLRSYEAHYRRLGVTDIDGQKCALYVFDRIEDDYRRG